LRCFDSPKFLAYNLGWSEYVTKYSTWWYDITIYIYDMTDPKYIFPFNKLLNLEIFLITATGDGENSKCHYTMSTVLYPLCLSKCHCFCAYTAAVCPCCTYVNRKFHSTFPSSRSWSRVHYIPYPFLIRWLGAARGTNHAGKSKVLYSVSNINK